MQKKTMTEALFHTKALRVAEADKPFWYTSGRIGPYYINTHFLYGSEGDALSLLSEIDRLVADKGTVSLKIAALTEAQYQKDETYRFVIDEMVKKVQEATAGHQVDLISGGERRDWFFSFMVAKLLKKPHLTLFKDNSAVLFDKGRTRVLFSIKDKVVLHVADLITSASSYQRAWLPVVEGLGAHMEYSLAVVDRLQGGGELLRRRGVLSLSMVAIDEALMRDAGDAALISAAQYEQLSLYMKDPDGTMAAFLKKTPEFLQNALQSDRKTKERAKLLVENDLYNLKEIV